LQVNLIVKHDTQ